MIGPIILSQIPPDLFHFLL